MMDTRSETKKFDHSFSYQDYVSYLVDATVLDDRKRPFVVIDPRAGQGPEATSAQEGGAS